jgi:hypothetical protein
MNVIRGNFLRLQVERKIIYSLNCDLLLKFSNKSFCYKYVPYKRIDFQDTNFYEPTTKLFQVESPINYKIRARLNFSLSLLCYLTLLSQPLNLNFVLLNLLTQPLLYYNRLKLKKRTSHCIKEIDLVKNGQQLLIKTENESFYIVHISDFEEIAEDMKQQRLVFKTYEKEFYIDFKQKAKIFNEELFGIIREGRIIDTNKSFQNYHRLTINR